MPILRLIFFPKYRLILALQTVLVLCTGVICLAALQARAQSPVAAAAPNEPDLQASDERSAIRERLRERFAHAKDGESAPGSPKTSSSAEKIMLAGLHVSVWKPAPSSFPAPWPTVIFSHGYIGSEGQSEFIMQALAAAGYLVIAPRHKDSLLDLQGLKSEGRPNFSAPAQWDENKFRDRHDDIVNLIAALRKDRQWQAQIDWSKFALSGHSLGGYTVLGLGGARADWKIPDVKAILALSPYCLPYLIKGSLSELGIPVMYQGGTTDRGITPSLSKADGAFDQSSSPAYFVEFDQLGHMGWTNFNKDQDKQKLIAYYCVSFLDKYVRGKTTAHPEKELAGVKLLRVK